MFERKENHLSDKDKQEEQKVSDEAYEDIMIPPSSDSHLVVPLLQE